MLKFLVYKEGLPVKEMDVSASYLIGPDEVPTRGEVDFSDGVISCRKHSEGAVALAVMWEMEGIGKFLLQTTRLADREEPYILNVELARWRLMRILQKQEDWGLFSYPEFEGIESSLQSSRKLFIQALQNTETSEKASVFADQSLKVSMESGEKLAKLYAQKMLAPRFQMGSLGRKVFGIRIQPGIVPEQLSDDILSTLNFIQLPLSWAEIKPEKKKFNFKNLDKWFEYLVKKRVTVKLDDVIEFTEKSIPVWLKKKKPDFEVLRDVLNEYLSNIATRYGKYIRSWTLLSGIHANNYFDLNFEQILDITRLCSIRAKQLCPRATSVIEIIYPWGEYYARNPRTIQPFLYADMVAQSGINFDGFGIRLLQGVANEGMYTRDFFQISYLLDRFSILGMPIHITTAVPSHLDSSSDAGYWEEPWTTDVQSRWMSRFCDIALSKSPVESITWDSLSDSVSNIVPYGGLFSKDWKSKPVFARIREMQSQLNEARSKARSTLE